ncbi:MAG: hypothetical protein ACOX9E_14950, partial [Lentisphaeria bacterium]
RAYPKSISGFCEGVERVIAPVLPLALPHLSLFGSAPCGNRMTIVQGAERQLSRAETELFSVVYVVIMSILWLKKD